MSFKYICNLVQRKRRLKGASAGEHSTIFIKGGFV